MPKNTLLSFIVIRVNLDGLNPVNYDFGANNVSYETINTTINQNFDSILVHNYSNSGVYASLHKTANDSDLNGVKYIPPAEAVEFKANKLNFISLFSNEACAFDLVCTKG